MIESASTKAPKQDVEEKARELDTFHAQEQGDKLKLLTSASMQRSWQTEVDTKLCPNPTMSKGMLDGAQGIVIYRKE